MSLSQRVRNAMAYGPAYLPLPHPSWRSTGWMTKNPWFENELLPVVRNRVAQLVW
jgi:uracil-DNA glycosylase